MALDKTPTTWIANWSENGINITVPLATFDELTAAEADAVTGDIRKIVFALIEHLYQTYIAKATADRPAKLTMTKTVAANAVRNTLTSRYVISITTDIGTQEVRAESSSSPSTSASATPSTSPSASTSASPSTSPSASVSSSPSTSVSASASSSPSSSPSAS